MLLLQLFILSLPGANAQGVTRLKPVGQPDTITGGAQDSLALSAPKGDIETTIKYSARDSILFEVGSKIVHLYGDAKINYGEITLEAAYIQINYETATLNATTLPDSTGKEVGTPMFVNGSEKYAAKRIAYNYKTKKGHISEVVTQQGEGYIHGEVVKRNNEEQISVYHARYTTCNLEHPHFYINADRIIAQPGKKVLSGPFNLVIGDIPTPLGFLFGLFPQPKANRASGVLIPTFGESRAQGFYLQNGGYYFAWNDYIGTSLTGDIYSLGGYNIRANNSYIKRYAYSGSLSIDYRYFKNDEADLFGGSRSTSDIRRQLPPSSRSIWFNWAHSPVQKPGRGRLSANVNAGSTIHQRINYNSSANFLAPTFNSNITYQKNIQNTPFSYTAKLSQGQTSSLSGKGIMNFVLPDLNFSMTPISFYEIFSKNTPTGQWYENFTIGYNVTARNEVSNLIPATGSISGGLGGSVEVLGGNRRSDTLDISTKNLAALWKNGRRSANHNFALGLGSFKILKYLNLSPSVTYQETWLDNKFSYTFDPDSQKVRVDTTNFGRVYDYSAGASLSTTIYGTAYIKGKRVEAIRHLIRPSISYSYRPDFGNERYGFYQNTLIGANETTLRPEYALLPRFNSNVPGYGLQSALSFNINNQIEMKVKSKSDSTSNKFEKVSLIDNLSLNGSYNFAADSFQLSQINVNMSTRLFKIINLSFNSTFDPYKIGSRVVTNNGVESILYTRVNEYEFDFSKLKFARLTNANLNISANLNPASRESNQRTPPQTNLPSMQPGMDPLNPLQPRYVDFKIPWTLNLDFTLYYAKALNPNDEDRIDKTLGVDGSLNLTDKWKFTYNASYNFRDNNIANANINIHRDLHCWEMSIGWVPFGFMQGYNVTINARSALLRDLRLTRNRSGFNR
ncbi:putative LPS assembly protein LptD [Pontibacter arcticus]|nr:putative LPS assembly protein LptD [Pontibacter arcticus]